MVDRSTLGYFTSWSDACDFINELNLQDEVEIEQYIDDNGIDVFEVIEREY